MSDANQWPLFGDNGAVQSISFDLRRVYLQPRPSNCLDRQTSLELAGIWVDLQQVVLHKIGR